MKRVDDQRLDMETVLPYRNWYDIHTQQAPESFSMSLNLIFAKPWSPQYSFDTRNGLVSSHIGGLKSDLTRIVGVARSLSPTLLGIACFIIGIPLAVQVSRMYFAHLAGRSDVRDLTDGNVPAWLLRLLHLETMFLRRVWARLRSWRRPK